LSLRLAIAGLLLSLGSCAQPGPPPPSGPPKFYVGNAFLSGGKWEYPHNFGSYNETGLSMVRDDSKGAITADNEAYDPDALQAGSAVLQLPSIVTITDLVTGRSVDVRVNDRLANHPGRLIGVTPKVAQVLGFPSDGVVEVEVTLNVQRTAALDGALGEGPKLTAAPEAGIEAQSLAPPGQAGSTSGAMQDLSVQASDPQTVDQGALSGQVTLTAPSPGPLWVQIPGFGRSRDADETLQYLYGMPAAVVPVFGGDRTLWAIKIGPYHSVTDADAALQVVLQRGVSDPEIIVR
jgi:rare lipoprotein A